MKHLAFVACSLVASASLLPSYAQDAPKVPYEINRDREDVPESEIPKREINLVMRLALSPDPDNVIKPGDIPMVDKVLKYYLNRLTWEEVQKERDPERVSTIDQIMSDLIGTVENSPRLLPRYFTGNAADQDVANQRQRQLTNVQLMTPIFLKHCRNVLRNKAPIARINAARVLARLAEWGQDAVLDEFINIINHPQESIAVKHWAFQGLEAIQLLQGTNDVRAKGLFQGKPNQARLNAALLATFNWLQSCTAVPATRMEFMKPDEQAGIRYVRRQAMKTLGASQRALIVDDRQTNKQEGAIVELLNKILAADPTITPAPDLRERLDAVYALARLRTDSSPSFNPDYTAQQIGYYLTVLGTEANTQKNNGNLTLAWGMEAEKLRAAFEGFSKQRMAAPASDYVGKLGAKVKPLLEYFNDFNVNTGSVRDLSEFIRDTKPASDKAIKPLGEK